MGLILTAKGADFEANAVSYIPPVPEGLLYWGFLNDSVEKLGRNYAPEGVPATVIGTPTVNSQGAVLNTAGHIQTPAVQTASITLIAVGRPVADGAEQGMFISNYTSARLNGVAGTSFGASLYCSGNDANAGKFEVRANVSGFSGVAGAASTLHQALLTDLDITKPAFLALTFDGTEKVVRAYNMSTGLSAAAAAYTEVVDIGVAPFRVGGAPLGTYPNNAKNFHFAAIYNRKLTDAELSLTYTRIKAYLAARGVAI